MPDSGRPVLAEFLGQKTRPARWRFSPFGKSLTSLAQALGEPYRKDAKNGGKSGSKAGLSWTAKLTSFWSRK